MTPQQKILLKTLTYIMVIMMQGLTQLSEAICYSATDHAKRTSQILHELANPIKATFIVLKILFPGYWRQRTQPPINAHEA